MRQETMYPRAAPRGVSLRLVAIVGSLAVCAVGVVLLLILLRETFDPLAREAAVAELERQAAISNRLYWLDLLVAGLWRLLPLMALGAAIWLALLTIYNRWGGRAAAASDKMVALQRARTQWLPSALQTLNYHDSSRPQLAPGPLSPLAELPAAPVAPPVPTFGELLATNAIGPDHPLILGYTQEGPLMGSWLDLYSVGIGGLQGSGKTWTAVYLACQSALNRAILAIVDKHAGDKESLATRLAPLSAAFICEPASDDQSILMLIALTMAEYQKRLADPNAPRRPFLFVCDEYTALMRGALAGPLSEVSEMLNEEGRKLDMFGLYMGQIWKGNRSGGTEARDALASCYIHRIKPRQGQMLSGLGDDLPDDVLHLPDGTAYLVTTRGTVERVTIPRMSIADLARVGQLLALQISPASSTESAAPRPFGVQLPPPTQPKISPESSQNHPKVSSQNAASGSAIALTPEEARIVALFLVGKDSSDIVTELTGMKSDAGKPYQKKLRQVQAVIRDEMRRQGAGRG